MTPETRAALNQLDPLLRDWEQRLEHGRQLRRQLLAADRRLAASTRRLAQTEADLAATEQFARDRYGQETARDS